MREAEREMWADGERFLVHGEKEATGDLLEKVWSSIWLFFLLLERD
jgi:hypothetical protein